MKILCAGVFPTLQRTLVLDSLKPGTVNRVKSAIRSVGGKAVNTARVLKTLGADPLLFGVSGGDTGTTIEQLLNEEGIAYRFIQTVAPVRFCQTLLAADTPDFTELVEEGPELLPEDWQRLVHTFTTMRAAGEEPISVISGTLPSHAPQDIYAQMMTTAGEAAPCILDTSGPALTHALVRRPELVKINAAELFHTVGSTDPERNNDRAIEAGAHVLIKGGAKAVGITQGGGAAWLITTSMTRRFIIPSIQVASTLGCGDAVNAGIAFAWQRGDSLETAFAFGLACGASNAMHRLPGCIDPEQVAGLALRIEGHR